MLRVVSRRVITRRQQHSARASSHTSQQYLIEGQQQQHIAGVVCLEQQANQLSEYDAKQLVSLLEWHRKRFWTACAHHGRTLPANALQLVDTGPLHAIADVAKGSIISVKLIAKLTLQYDDVELNYASDGLVSLVILNELWWLELVFPRSSEHVVLAINARSNSTANTRHAHVQPDVQPIWLYVESLPIIKTIRSLSAVALTILNDDESNRRLDTRLPAKQLSG